MGGGGLAARAAELGSDRYDPAGLLAEFRAAPVMVPVTAEGSWWAADLGGVRWLYAFSSEAALSRFAVERDGGAGNEWSYVSVYGARLLDVALPGLGVPAGVVLDVAGPSPAFFPPGAGGVPGPATVALRGADRRG
ncbi:SseB family protein [Kitasatospora sp. NPDC056138]|uniref:SseB family protein n=1 Tax=Kitasatospora sp. NPDC056138 TaxID=3345724 RepID=UPI0035D8ADF4